MEREKQLSETAEIAVRAATGAGADAADVMILEEDVLHVEVEKNIIRFCDRKRDAGLSARAFRRGGTGFAQGMGTGVDSARTAGAEAAAMAAMAQPDPDFRDLPHPAEYSRVDGLFDPDVEGLEAAAVTGWARRAVRAALDAHPEVTVKCGVTVTARRTARANHNGVLASVRTTSAGLYVFAVLRRGEDVGSFYEFTHARRLADLRSPEWVGREAATLAARYLGARKVRSGSYPVLLSPVTAHEFLRAVCDAASAEEVQRDRTYLAHKRGERIAADLVTVTEEPLVPAGAYSGPFDGEGVPRLPGARIENGVLTGYLHNSYTAGKAGEQTTGHATRSHYTSGVGIATTNLHISPGDVPEAELLRRMGEGVYVHTASLAPNEVSGEISATLDSAFWVENGELAYPLSNVMLGGSIFELLGAVEAVASDAREEPGNVLRAILIGSGRIAGGDA